MDVGSFGDTSSHRPNVRTGITNVKRQTTFQSFGDEYVCIVLFVQRTADFFPSGAFPGLAQLSRRLFRLGFPCPAPCQGKNTP